MQSLTLKSYGKVNLGLQVLGKRKDGYHEIETILATIDLHDEITLTRSDKGIRVKSDNKTLPSQRRNLAYRAAELLLKEKGVREGVEIFIHKRIPVGVGLGGWSSNGATVLKGLLQLYEIPCSNRDLLEMAKELGSDLPFFLKGGVALAKGRGEILFPLSLPSPIWFVLVFPGFPISTLWAYQNLDLTIPSRSLKILTRSVERGDLYTLAEKLVNSFEEVMFREYPVLKVVKERLLRHGALGASLSGSGSSIFGICEDEDSALRIASHISPSEFSEEKSEFFVVVTKTVREVQEDGDH